jgi:hypothetical protein
MLFQREYLDAPAELVVDERRCFSAVANIARIKRRL